MDLSYSEVKHGDFDIYPDARIAPYKSTEFSLDSNPTGVDEIEVGQDNNFGLCEYIYLYMFVYIYIYIYIFA